MSDALRSPMKHEPDTTSVAMMTSAGLGLLFLVLAAVAVAGLVFRYALAEPRLASAEQKASEQQLNPGVQPNQAFDRRQLEIQQRQLLGDFEWLNKEQRLASIPIEQAITIMAQRQLRVGWAAVEPARDAPTEKNRPNSAQSESQPPESKPPESQPPESKPPEDNSRERTPPSHTQPTERP